MKSFSPKKTLSSRSLSSTTLNTMKSLNTKALSTKNLSVMINDLEKAGRDAKRRSDNNRKAKDKFQDLMERANERQQKLEEEKAEKIKENEKRNRHRQKYSNLIKKRHSNQEEKQQQQQKQQQDQKKKEHRESDEKWKKFVSLFQHGGGGGGVTNDCAIAGFLEEEDFTSSGLDLSHSEKQSIEELHSLERLGTEFSLAFNDESDNKNNNDFERPSLQGMLKKLEHAGKKYEDGFRNSC